MSLEREDSRAPGLHCPRPRQEEGTPYEVTLWTPPETYLSQGIGVVLQGCREHGTWKACGGLPPASYKMSAQGLFSF
jgi:hypothetical protein